MTAFKKATSLEVNAVQTSFDTNVNYKMLC